jgi:hypothetical protein
MFPVHPTAGRKRATHAGLRQRIIEWAREAASQLHEECPERLSADWLPHGYEGERQTEIDGLALSLRRVVRPSESCKHDGALWLYRIVGEDVEEQRLVRITTALQKKLPKLRECRSEGDTTILILEYSDIALTNQIVVGEALEQALQEQDDWPDYIFLADTTLAGAWNFFQPLARGEFTLNMPYINVPLVDPMSASQRQ